MAKQKNIAGRRFGRLTAIQSTNRRTKSRHTIWECQCECGNVVDISVGDLMNGHTCSCGCLREELRVTLGKLRTGGLSNCWKGGITHVNGYVLRQAKHHPFCSKNGYVLEHRLAMERKIGRYLTENEVVHHKNGKVADNRIENLKLMTNGEHLAYHCKMATRRNKNLGGEV